MEGYGKPNVEVMNFFEKKTYENRATDKVHIETRFIPPKPQVKPLFEYEGKYEVTSEDIHEDENVNNAKIYRQNK